MGTLDATFLEEVRKDFESCPKNHLAQNVCFRQSPMLAALERTTIQSVRPVFSHKVDPEGKPMTNQKRSGRCWIFALLNTVRVPVMKHFDLEELELSQPFLAFWDKIERANFFLHKIVEAYKDGEKTDGRLISFLLYDPVQDGGQWDMLVNLVKKYGLMPKSAYADSACCEDTGRVNSLLKNKLRQFARDLKTALDQGSGDVDIEAKIKEYMKVIYRITAICLGIPPSHFDWEFIDKKKQYKKIPNLTPLDFYETHVKPLFDLDEKICLVNDPRPTSEFGRPLFVQYLGNVVGGRETVYNNQEIEVMMRAVRDSIKANEPVWFGCDVSASRCKGGVMSTDVRNYKLLFDEDFILNLSKAEKLTYGQSQMTHAMVLTGVTCETDDSLPSRYKVENSWGEDDGEKGYSVMTNDWFREYVYEVVVDKKFLSEDVLAALDKERIVLPPWDPMGSLA